MALFSTPFWHCIDVSNSGFYHRLTSHIWHVRCPSHDRNAVPWRPSADADVEHILEAEAFRCAAARRLLNAVYAQEAAAPDSRSPLEAGGTNSCRGREGLAVRAAAQSLGQQAAVAGPPPSYRLANSGQATAAEGATLVSWGRDSGWANPLSGWRRVGRIEIATHGDRCEDTSRLRERGVEAIEPEQGTAADAVSCVSKYTY